MSVTIAVSIAETIRHRFYTGSLECRDEQKLLYHAYKRARDGEDTEENLRTMIACHARSDYLANVGVKPQGR